MGVQPAVIQNCRPTVSVLFIVPACYSPLSLHVRCRHGENCGLCGDKPRGVAILEEITKKPEAAQSQKMVR